MMDKLKYIVLFVIVLTMSSPVGTNSTDLQEVIRSKVELIQVHQKNDVQGDLICALTVLPEFYQQRNFQAAWVNENGVTPIAQTLIKVINNAEQEGLTPQDYHLNNINMLHQFILKFKGQLELKNYLLADIDLLLTDAYLLYASHLQLGKLNPESLVPEWKAQKRTSAIQFDRYLENAILANAIEESLNKLVPSQNEYWELKKALALYNGIKNNGGWNKVTEGGMLEVGVIDERVEQLRKRLELSNYLIPTKENRKTYDELLKDAVRNFQRNNGINDDGVVDHSTIKVLNISVEERIVQVKVNMERWRWLPDNLGDRHIRVNIANFELDVFENKNIVLTSKAIVGRIYRKTPVFSAMMTYLVLNPYWTIPSGILRNDVLPAVKKDAGYLSGKRIKVLDASGNVIDPKGIDWQTANIGQYTFRQDPGKDNSLGLLKFMFPNSYNVYIHDTPAKELFDKEDRVFSSGCIRIQKPYELAEYLLQGQDDWNREKLDRLTRPNSKPLTVTLNKSIAVHILYLTAWGVTDKPIQFRKDIYERDQIISSALSEYPPKL